MSPSSNRGHTLATTLVAIGLALVLGLALTNASVSHLTISKTSTAQQRAMSAAEAALAEAYEKIAVDPQFGLSSGLKTIEFEGEGSRSWLSFDEDFARSKEIPVSTSNRFGLKTISGQQGELIPPHSIQVYALGESGNSKVLLESVLQVPEFPYAVACSGPIQSTGSLVVGTIGLEDELESSKLRSTAISSHGDMSLTGEAEIVGDLESKDEISLGNQVNVNGEVRPHTEPLELNDLNISNLRPSDSLPLTNFLAPSLTGHFHHNGPQITISQGLKLQDAIVFLNGDTVISGGIHGKGAVIVNGSLTIQGGSTLSADGQLALVSQGDLRIEGDSHESSFFQGLIYTEGDFSARDITLVGAFVANQDRSSSPAGSQMELHNARVINKPEYSRFSLSTEAYVVWENPALNIEANVTAQSSGGRENLYLIDIDEKDLPVLQSALRIEEDSSNPRGGSKYKLNINMGIVRKVLRGRKAPTQDGELIGDWEELGPEDVMKIFSKTQPRGSWSRTPPSMELGLSSFQAEPGSIFEKLSRASIYLDFNEFLSPKDRLRVASWRKR